MTDAIKKILDEYSLDDFNANKLIPYEGTYSGHSGRLQGFDFGKDEQTLKVALRRRDPEFSSKLVAAFFHTLIKRSDAVGALYQYPKTFFAFLDIPTNGIRKPFVRDVDRFFAFPDASDAQNFWVFDFVRKMPDKTLTIRAYWIGGTVSSTKITVETNAFRKFFEDGDDYRWPEVIAGQISPAPVPGPDMPPIAQLFWPAQILASTRYVTTRMLRGQPDHSEHMLKSVLLGHMPYWTPLAKNSPVPVAKITKERLALIVKDVLLPMETSSTPIAEAVGSVYDEILAMPDSESDIGEEVPDSPQMDEPDLDYEPSTGTISDAEDNWSDWE